MVVGDEVNLAVACRLEEDFDGRLLAEADLENKPAVRDEQIEGVGDEAAVDFKAVVSGEECGVRFMFADFYRESVFFRYRYVWGIGGDDLEALAGEWRE